MARSGRLVTKLFWLRVSSRRIKSKQFEMLLRLIRGLKIWIDKTFSKISKFSGPRKETLVKKEVQTFKIKETYSRSSVS